eukprot:8961570-Ditylum_brightwellii.AAC.1
MEAHKDGKGSSGSEKSMDVEEKKKVKEGIKRKTTGKKPTSVTSSQGRRYAVKKKMTKAKMEDKGTL